MKNPSVNSIVERLEPCPFCGEANVSLNPPNKHDRYGSINCPACLAVMPGEVSDVAELVSCWNNRTAATIISELQAENERLQIEVFELKHGVEDQMEEAAYHRERRAAAESSLSRIKAETIEECAKIAELKYASSNLNPIGNLIAEDIRSLGSTGGAEKTAESEHSPSTQNTRTE